MLYFRSNTWLKLGHVLLLGLHQALFQGLKRQDVIFVQPLRNEAIEVHRSLARNSS
jgi:hypothetical protein